MDLKSMLNETNPASTAPKPSITLASPSPINRSSSYLSRPTSASYTHYASPSHNASLHSRPGVPSIPLGPPVSSKQHSPPPQTPLSQEPSHYATNSYSSVSGS